MGDYQVRTKSGYDFFEVSSALQKSIRRCNEDEAMFWAIELYKSNYAKYLWKRMLIMTSEDVGLANPVLGAQMIALKQSYDYLAGLKDKHTPEVLPFFHALLLLVRSKKSRFVDLAFSVYWKAHNDNAGKHEVPDYALDKHTRRGKAKGRGLDHFYEEGAKINNKAQVEREDEFFDLAWKADAEKYAKMAAQKDDEDSPEDAGTEVVQGGLFD